MTNTSKKSPGPAPKKKRSGNRKRTARKTSRKTEAKSPETSPEPTSAPVKKKRFGFSFKNPFKKAAAEPTKAAPKGRRKSKKDRLQDPDAQIEAKKYENPVASRKLILQLIHEHGALTQESLAEKLNLTEPDVLEALRRRLIAMTRDGQLIRNRRGGFIPVDERNLIRGRVIAHPDGFGFLVPEEGGDDLFLSGKQMRSLLHGDRAVVQVAGIDRRGRREGALVEVLERANHTLVGRLHIESSVAFMVADNKRITQDILIPGDKLGEAKAGQIVKVEIVKQPSFRSQPIGKVLGVVGDHMAPGMEIEVAIHSHGLPHEFSTAVLNEADELGDQVRADDKQGRLDLRHLPLVTIDGEDARDFDDAVYCEPVEQSGQTQWRLLVAIADVAHYVDINSALDKEAYERATSVYFPGRVIPMLPEGISNGLCSLNPAVDRLAMVCEMQINQQGEIVSHSFHEAVFRSQARLTYNQVASALVDKDEAECKRLADVLPHLKNLHALYDCMAKARKKRGSIDFDTTETRIVFNDDQRIESIYPTIRNDAHKIIEECMIAANICAASFISKHKVPSLYRVHDLPDDDKLEDLRGFLKDLGLRLGEPQRKIESSDYAKLTDEIKDRDDRHVIQVLLLRSMRQAMYKPENSGHFGLALDNYAHFTSPIRRYPDLLVHRAIKHIVRKLPLRDYPYDMKRMGTMGEHCSANERRADEATRDAELALKCEYMLDKIGQEFSAHITSVVSFGLFVEIDDLYVEGLVHITSLPKDFYEFNPASHQLVGERHGRVFNMRDKVRVRVARVDMDERKLDFELV
jgi:ribonuclease R